MVKSGMGCNGWPPRIKGEGNFRAAPGCTHWERIMVRWWAGHGIMLSYLAKHATGVVLCR